MRCRYHFPSLTPLFLLLMLLNGAAHSATIHFPLDLDILFHNKEKIRTFSSGRSLTIAQGKHQFVVRYNKLFERRGEHTQAQSQPIIIELNVEKSNSLTVLVPEFNRSRQALKFAKQPYIELIDATKQAYPFTIHTLAPYSGFTMTRDILAEVKNWEMSRLVTSQTNSDAAKQVEDIPPLANENTALEMLKFWYHKASPETQRQFKHWVEAQQ